MNKIAWNWENEYKHKRKAENERLIPIKFFSLLPVLQWYINSIEIKVDMVGRLLYLKCLSDEDIQ